MTLKVADRLGRSRGRLAVLDQINPPAPARHKPDMSHWSSYELAATWIGHATVLLRIGGITILTDPVFSSRVGVGMGLMTAGPKRTMAPALSIAELPEIDLILISHAHFDHLDRPTLARLPKKIPVVTARGTSDLIYDIGYRKVTELNWDDKLQFRPDVRLIALPSVHWGARTFHDRHRGFNSYLIEAGDRRVLYGGDTAYHDELRKIGKVDLAILGIGAYDPYVAAHATPEQAWAMAGHCQATSILPIHHGTFRLSHEPMDEPIRRMLAAAGRDCNRVVIREAGELWVAEPHYFRWRNGAYDVQKIDYH
ncbi:MAG TPA: MBL fold metallo-hydrolase [Tepidisphaeraceae bacterium]|jgi:L-ascorbate metabolism protein UlaG (beta-lactamase superfamily)|nr:MBL fold metallo-hydrolase [Tepidisphaeraceae bacterium]